MHEVAREGHWKCAIKQLCELGVVFSDGGGADNAVFCQYEHNGRARKELQTRLHDGLEHGLHVIRRTSNHLKDFSRGRLPLQRLARLVEQPRVLDCDDSLIGKGLEQLHVVVGK